MKETEQTLLDQIKDQVAREVSFHSAMTAKEFIELEFSYTAQHEFINLVCERYYQAKAKASCEATLKNAADKVCKDDEKWILPIGHKLIRISITDPKNIVIL